MQTLIENEIQTTYQEEKENQWDIQGNISLADRSETALLHLPEGSPLLVIGHGDEIIIKRHKEFMSSTGIIKVNPDEPQTINPEIFELVIGNVHASEIAESLPLLHQLTRPYADLFMNIYDDDKSFSSDEIDQLFETEGYFLRGTSRRIGHSGRAWWEIDMMNTPKDLPSFQRGQRKVYRTGPAWDEYYS